MIVIKLRGDKLINEKFRKFDIDRRKLENFLGYLTNNLIPTRKPRWYEIKVKGIKGTSSQYFWNEDEIEVALQAFDCNTKKKRRIYFLKSIAHEYRHWVQAQIENVSGKKVNYTEKDVEENNKTYTQNKYELECAEWEDLIEKFNDFI